jgi:FkbM family methyltransferase
MRSSLIAFIPHFAKTLAKKLLCKIKRPHRIGRYTILLPGDSRVVAYKSAFGLYDTALGDIAAIVRAKYPNLHAIDVGAYVGDSAALIRASGDIPVLCIEGDRALFSLLAENLSRMGAGIEIEQSFVGADGDSVDPNKIDNLGRTASLVGASKADGTIPLRSLDRILDGHTTFRNAKLLKTDVEGYDFDILRQSIGLIRKVRPVIFFEYAPYFRPEAPDAGLDTIRLLIESGYSDFLYYDNFGNSMAHVKAEQLTLFSDLHGYLASHRKFGTAVYYFDICAFHADDAELASEVGSASLKRLASSLFYD